MQNKANKPIIVLAVALTAFVSAGFLLLVQIGTSARKNSQTLSGFNFRGSPAPAASVVNDLERGGSAVMKKGEDLYSSFFGGGAQAASPSGRSGTARQEYARNADSADSGDAAGDSEGDAFEEYYKKNYSSQRGKSAEAGLASWGGLGGGGSASGGGSEGGFGEAPAQEGYGKVAKKGEEDKSASSEPGSSPGAAAGRPSAGAAPGLQASLPWKKSSGDSRLDFGRQPGIEGAKADKQAYKGGNLSGMAGQKAAASLDGAAEGMKAGAQSNYNSKMSGDAASAGGSASGGGSSSGGGASSSGKASPEASAPAGVSAAGAAKASSGTEAEVEGTSYLDSYDGPAAAADQDLFAAVVTEKQNGLDGKFILSDEAAGDPDEAHLKARTVAESAATKEAAAPDPANLKNLSEARKTELKKDIHTFMKKVENRYGVITDIHRVACATTPEICKDHEVKGSYITMATKDGAKLTLGVKYVDKRWRRYTMDFKAPPGQAKPAKPPVSEEVEDEEVLAE